MSDYLLESEVYFHKYTCHSCGNSIYCDYKNLGNCPHCGVECVEETKNTAEEVTATIFYEIDPKTGEVSVLHLCD